MNDSSTMRYTHLWERLIAALIDFLVLAVPGILVDSLVDAYKHVWFFYLITLISASYFTILEGPMGQGQTFGKRAVGIRAVRIDGSLLSYADALRRYFFGCLLAYMFFLLAALVRGSESLFWIMPALTGLGTCYTFLDWIILIRDPQRRGLHDYLSNTVVLKTGETFPTEWPQQLPRPLPSVPWRRYWLGTGAVLLYGGLQILIAFVARGSERTSSLTAFQHALSSTTGVVIVKAQRQDNHWILDISKPSWNPIRRRLDREPAQQEELVKWITQEFIQNHAIDPTMDSDVVYNFRRSFFHSMPPSDIWTVDTRTLASKHANS